jgi:glycosyltransferase involved in cell wall biosynthesis
MTVLNKTNTLVIVPAYNEQDSIVSVIEEIKATGFPFVVIDDGSTDETRKRAIAAGARTISLPFNAGVGGALKCGFQYAVKKGYQAVIQCDADNQHPISQFNDLLVAANASSAKIVIGSRFTSEFKIMKINKSRRFAMKILAFIATRVTKNEITDATSGFRVISQPLLREFAESFPTYYLGDTFEALIVAGRANYQVSEIGAQLKDRTMGLSTAKTHEALSMIVKTLLVTLFWTHFRIANAPDGLNK